jgi:hypothetical protein
MKPESLNICGIPHSITYCGRLTDVTENNRETNTVGEIDLVEKKIRIYDNGQPVQAVWQVLIHEVLHCIGCSNSLEILNVEYDSTITKERKHNELDSLATALTDFLFRNNLIKTE